MPNAPVNLKDLFRRQKTIAFAYDTGEDGAEPLQIEITFNPKKYTARAHALMMSLSDEKGFDGIVGLLDRLLVSSILLGEDGKKLPCGKDGLEDLPVDLLLKLSGEIMGSISDQAPTSGGSLAG